MSPDHINSDAIQRTQNWFKSNHPDILENIASESAEMVRQLSDNTTRGLQLNEAAVIEGISNIANNALAKFTDRFEIVIGNNMSPDELFKKETATMMIASLRKNTSREVNMTKEEAIKVIQTIFDDLIKIAKGETSEATEAWGISDLFK